MCEFRSLLNTFSTHLTAANIKEFITLTEHLITLGAAVAAGTTNPVAATVDVLSTVGAVVAEETAPTSPSNPV